jgi:hypothetical protein
MLEEIQRLRRPGDPITPFEKPRMEQRLQELRQRASLEVYVTNVDQEAYDLSGQLALASVRSRVTVRRDKAGAVFYVVVVEAPEALDRARAVRRKMFGS